MIDPDFLIFNESGLYCKPGDFYIDPQKPVCRALVSHAHADHAKSGNTHVYCTAATAAIMEHRYKKNAAVQFHLKPFSSGFEVNGVKIQFLPAGHILGSAQILMEYNGIKYLYTGDFKLQKDVLCEPLEFVPADVLITETTFADPAVSHPDPATEIQKLNTFSHHVLLGAYSLGKSQRLINLIETYCPGRRVLVHHSIVPVNKIYEKFSFAPGRYELYNRKMMKLHHEGLVYIVPPLTFDCYIRAKNVVRVFASGWNNLQVQNGVKLFISDHADWNDLLTLIAEVNPKEIWTLHGNGQHLKEHFSGILPVKILQHGN